MELKVIEPIQHYSKEFNTPDEFNLWYSKNKASVDELTTHKLNKMYHIDGYRITRIKNQLMLKKWDKNKVNIEEEMDNIKNDIKNLQDAVNKIILYLKPNENVET